jgi:hypothetical protein
VLRTVLRVMMRSDLLDQQFITTPLVVYQPHTYRFLTRYIIFLCPHVPSSDLGHEEMETLYEENFQVLSNAAMMIEIAAHLLHNI